MAAPGSSDGWGLARVSNSQSALVMRYKAQGATQLAGIKVAIGVHFAAATPTPT